MRPEIHKAINALKTALDSAKDVRRLDKKEKVSFIDVMESVSNDTKIRDIPLITLDEHAARFGYLLPSVGVVEKASGVLADVPQKQLTLTVSNGGKRFELTEYPQVMSKEQIGQDAIVQSERVDSAEVLLVRDSGTGATFTYFIGTGFTCVLNGDNFNNDSLREVILSFRSSDSAK